MNRNKSRVLVTGAGGFIGHHLVTFLKAQGHVVRGVDLKLHEHSEVDADGTDWRTVNGSSGSTDLIRHTLSRWFKMPTKRSFGQRGLTAEHRPTSGSFFGPRNREADMDFGDEFALVVEQDGRGSVVRIIGDLDIATAPQLRECLTYLVGTTVTLDFSGVTFMDSGGIAVLAWAMKRARQRGSELHIRGVRPPQMRVLEITGMDAELNFDG